MKRRKPNKTIETISRILKTTDREIISKYLLELKTKIHSDYDLGKSLGVSQSSVNRAMNELNIKSDGRATSPLCAEVRMAKRGVKPSKESIIKRIPDYGKYEIEIFDLFTKTNMSMTEISKLTDIKWHIIKDSLVRVGGICLCDAYSISEIHTEFGKFCTNCNKKTSGKSVLREDQKIRNKVVFICKTCGAEFKNKHNNRVLRFCSQSCVGKFYEKEYSDGRFAGSNNPMFGTKRTKEEIKRISETKIKNKTHKGEKNGRYIDGRCSIGSNRSMKSFEYANWRKKVFERDEYKCQFCNKLGNGDLNAHHIKPWSKYIELRFEVSNGLTLCKECHKTTLKEVKLA